MTQDYTGKSYYLSDYVGADGQRLLVAVPCRVADLPQTFYALLDTGATWGVLPAPLAEALGCDLAIDETIPPLQTWRGEVRGRLERLDLILPAEDGEDVQVEATWFVSAEWQGPMVIGWVGCLQRLRIGLDPSQDAFLFGAP